MTDSTLIEQAKLGDPEAIATLMNQSLQSKGLRAIVDRQGDRLEVILEAERVPNRQALTGFVAKGISNLGIQSSTPISGIRILGRQTGASSPAWTQELKLDPSSNRVIPIDPSSIQSETAPPPLATPGMDDFSSPSVTNSAAFETSPRTAWLGQPTAATESNLSPLELEGLDEASAVAEPDFLQELLSSSADLPADESMEANDEGLLDFLNELSGPSSAAPFPDEAVQDLSNFEGSSATEEGNFQELFAESSEFSLESELEPWEDSSEALPGGEPDADLLNFLAASDAEPDSATDFSPQLAELHEFPDAASIDQLPESWMNETPEPTASPLEEPPAEFLTNLLGEPTRIPDEPFSASAPEPSVTSTAWPEATPDSGEDLQQSLVNQPLADPWAEEPFVEAAVTAEPAVDFSPAPVPEQPDYELSSVGLSPEPESLPVEPPAEPPTWIQSTWIQPDAAEATLRSESFPAEPTAETSTWIQPDELDETVVEEGLPDFLLEPRLDLPESDPVEMTYEEALQQPDVLEATLTQEELGSVSTETLISPDTVAAEGQSLHLEPYVAPPPAAIEWTVDEAMASDPESSESAQPEANTASDFQPVDQPEPNFTDPDFAPFEAELPASTEPRDAGLMEPPAGEPSVEPELAELSSFADQQSTDWSWTETSEDYAVEEMPPDFLLELENEFLTGSSSDGVAHEPGWIGLEADLAAMELTTDSPEAAETTDSAETASAEIPTLNLEDLMRSGASTPADAAAHPDLEMISETEEGTAVEPPENWLASLREPAADWNDIQPEPAVAAEPPLVEPSAHTPLVSDPVVSTVTQDELEAGLGDFREGFVEPLPPEFFEDEAPSDYPDWRSELGEPLTVPEDSTGAGYIIEDSEEIMPAVIPPAATDDADLEEPLEPRSSEWIFPAVLLTVCGLLAGFLGFSLFSARIGPRQPAPPPTEEPPAPEQAPSAPSPTSAQPAETWVSELPANLPDRN